MKAERFRQKRGSVLVLVIVSLMILTALGVALLMVGYGVRLRAIQDKTEAVAMLAAEAGYEKAIFWMSQQQDMLSALQKGVKGTKGEINFPAGTCDYRIELFTFAGSRPVYRVVSKGWSGKFSRTVEVLVVQAASGWDMGMCRIPLGRTETGEVNFVTGELMDIPLQINNFEDKPDKRDIYIIGSPDFLQSAGMGESRYTSGGLDKYKGVMGLFDSGIYFDQPDSRITDEDSMKSKIKRFRDSTKPAFRFKPAASSKVKDRHAAVQLEFFVQNGNGKVRITDNCSVRGYQRNSDSKTLDFKIKPGSNSSRFERYDIYAYHYMPENGSQVTLLVTKTYVSQSFGTAQSQPGGQIYVDGDVVIGGDNSLHDGDQQVKGRLTVVATGNIWVADSVRLDGPHDKSGRPAADNPNVLGLIAQGIVKVVDPGISSYDSGDKNKYPGPPSGINGLEYVPVGRQDTEGKEVRVKKKVGKRGKTKWVTEIQPPEPYERHLPNPMVVESAVTVGGGGWGAENVRWTSGWTAYGGRKETSTNGQDRLELHGTITEAMRGVVGSSGGGEEDGFLKHYYMDARLLEGVLPGDMWLRGKYIPAPAGWSDYRAAKLD